MNKDIPFGLPQLEDRLVDILSRQNVKEHAVIQERKVVPQESFQKGAYCEEETKRFFLLQTWNLEFRFPAVEERSSETTPQKSNFPVPAEVNSSTGETTATPAAVSKEKSDPRSQLHRGNRGRHSTERKNYKRRAEEALKKNVV